MSDWITNYRVQIKKICQRCVDIFLDTFPTDQESDRVTIFKFKKKLWPLQMASEVKTVQIHVKRAQKLSSST